MAPRVVLLLATLACASALFCAQLQKWTATTRLTRPHPPSMANLASPNGDVPERIPAAFNPARELERYKTARFRVMQSGPIRRGVGLIDDAVHNLGIVFRFYTAALRTISVYRALLVLTLLAFGFQQVAGRAATVAG